MAKRRAGKAIADDKLSLRNADQSSRKSFANGTEHLLAELNRLELMLQRQVLRLRAAKLITEDEFRGLYISDEQVDILLSRTGKPDSASQSRDDNLTKTRALTTEIKRVEKENEERVKASLRAGINLPIARLVELFGLNRFERDTLLISLAPELDARHETLYAYIQNDITKRQPTIDLILSLLCSTLEERLAHRAHFANGAALLRNYLVRLFDDPQGREPTMLMRFVKADERIIDFLLGSELIDARLLAFTERVTARRNLQEMALAEELRSQLSHAAESLRQSNGMFFFHGPYGVGKQAAAEAICAHLGMALLVADLGQIQAANGSFPTTIALLRREALLRSAALYLNHFEVLLVDENQTRHQLAAITRELEQPASPVFLSSQLPWQAAGLWPHTRFLRFDFPVPAFPLRLRLWEEALSDNGHRLHSETEMAAVANKFVLSAGQIFDAAREAVHMASLRPQDQHGICLDDLHTAARDQSNHGLRRLAQKVEPVYKWADIILPRRAMKQLREVATSVKYRHVVYSQWGFDQKLSLGKGLNVLFSGSSGTGKTMAAQILARELGFDIYKIDLSSVVSKYVGETEKNLGQIFREAQSSNAILFFDEADALFGKRSEVKDAHDRYANIEVAYLLQKMEEYEGIVILATNLGKNLDEAFARRMHHTIEFPFPDASYRERIWRALFPADAPLADDVDFAFLARQFEMAGGNIRNVALAAAFMAAELGDAIHMQQLIVATARELQKMGRMPSKADFRDYFEIIRERG